LIYYIIGFDGSLKAEKYTVYVTRYEGIVCCIVAPVCNEVLSKLLEIWDIVELLMMLDILGLLLLIE